MLYADWAEITAHCQDSTARSRTLLYSLNSTIVNSLCLIEAEANKVCGLGRNICTSPACLLNHFVVQQALLCALRFSLYLLCACFSWSKSLHISYQLAEPERVCLGCIKGQILANLL
ncbi:hypothetical protein PROFUN_15295, partial [Planoprotostelium fungivorum]